MIPRWRSLLFVAALDDVRLEKVARRGADAVIVDLEDAVPPGRKAEARSRLATVLDRLSEDRCALVVRVNSDPEGLEADLLEAVHPAVSAVMIPKVEDADALRVLVSTIAALARSRGLPPPGVIALIESPLGLSRLASIAEVGGVEGLALGTEDFSLALGVRPTPEALELPCRMLAVYAAIRGQSAFALPVSIATIDDEAGWATAISRARAMGLTGALCVHPRQVGPVNEGFAPAPDELQAARKILEAWSQREGAGAIMVDGRMVDPPVVAFAERTIASAWDR